MTTSFKCLALLSFAVLLGCDANEPRKQIKKDPYCEVSSREELARYQVVSWVDQEIHLFDTTNITVTRVEYTDRIYTYLVVDGNCHVSIIEKGEFTND